LNKNDTGKVIANHDKFFRGSMERLEIAKDFFAAHLAPSVLKKIQLDTLMLESSTFIDEVHKELRSDILYSVTVDNKIGYLYLVVEHQSKPDKLMAFRLLNYVCRIWQRCIDQQRNVRNIASGITPRRL
jgi:predicted transposase/invertase (TIGR01784 family)